MHLSGKVMCIISCYNDKSFVLILHLAWWTSYLKKNADIQACNSAGKQSLMLACCAGHLDVVKKLRSSGAELEARDTSGCTALHWAVQGENTDVIKWMLQNGAQVGYNKTQVNSFSIYFLEITSFSTIVIFCARNNVSS